MKFFQLNSWGLALVLALLVGLSACKSRRESGAQEACIDKSKIDPNRPCPKNFRPVCGCDGVTYSNVCYAEKAGVLKWTEGKCK